MLTIVGSVLKLDPHVMQREVPGWFELAWQDDLVLEVHGGTHAGIWQPVTLRTTGPAHLLALRVLTRDADTENAHVLLSASIDSSRALTCTGA